MQKIITFQEHFLNYPGSELFLSNIKETALTQGEVVRIAMSSFPSASQRIRELKQQGIIDYLQTVESFQNCVIAAGIPDYSYLPGPREAALRNRDNPDWALLSKAAFEMGLPTDEKSLRRFYANIHRRQASEQKHDTAYFSPLLFMMDDSERGMAVDYDWGNYKRIDSFRGPLFRREPIHLQGNHDVANDEGFALICYPSQEILSILENAQTGKTKEHVLLQLGSLINGWDGSPLYFDIGAEWGIYTEGSALYRQAELWLWGNAGVEWRQTQEKR